MKKYFIFIALTLALHHSPAGHSWNKCVALAIHGPDLVSTIERFMHNLYRLIGMEGDLKQCVLKDLANRQQRLIKDSTKDSTDMRNMERCIRVAGQTDEAGLISCFCTIPKAFLCPKARRFEECQRFVLDFFSNSKSPLVYHFLSKEPDHFKYESYKKIYDTILKLAEIHVPGLENIIVSINDLKPQEIDIQIASPLQAILSPEKTMFYKKVFEGMGVDISRALLSFFFDGVRNKITGNAFQGLIERTLGYIYPNVAIPTSQHKVNALDFFLSLGEKRYLDLLSESGERYASLTQHVDPKSFHIVNKFFKRINAMIESQNMETMPETTSSFVLQTLKGSGNYLKVSNLQVTCIMLTMILKHILSDRDLNCEDLIGAVLTKDIQLQRILLQNMFPEDVYPGLIHLPVI